MSTSESAQRKHPLAKCSECPLYEDGKYVPTEFNGNSNTKVVFVGEAPGQKEARQGKPFVGPSGKLLDAIMREHGIDRSATVLTNTVACRPRGNATPTAPAIQACSPRLWSEIHDVEPKYVVALGKTAASTILGSNVKITQERVGPPKALDGESFRVIPTIHPAATLRNPNLFPLLAADVGKVVHSAKITWEPPTYKVLDNATQARAACIQLLQRGRAEKLVIDIEVGEDKDTDYGHPNTLLAVGIGYEPGKVVVLGREALRSNAVRRELARLLEAKKLVCQNGKYDLGVFHRMGIGTFKLHADTMLMSYTQDEVPGTHGLKYLAKEHLGAPDWDQELKDAGGFVAGEALYKYNAYDVACTWDLMELFYERMDSNDIKLHEFLCRASDQIMLIESEGIYIDQDALRELERGMKGQMKELKATLRELVNFTEVWDGLDEYTTGLIDKGSGFNPNSVPQVKGVLESMLGATITTTDADMLEHLADHKLSGVRQFAKAMLEWRSVGKLYGTYVKGTQRRLGEDGRLRTTYKIHGTETGRLSSANPNVQNVPRQGGIREVYAAAPGNLIVYADYSNIEGRVVATLARSESMRSVFNEDRDIHGEVAAGFYGPDYTKEQRVLAKSVVHGVNYARTPEGIAEGLGVSLSEAKKVYNTYHQMFPEVKVWHAAIKHQVLSTEELLVSPWGRKRRFGLITRDNQEDVYKEALAFLPQSIASDICLTAGIELKRQGLSVRILIHDGIVVEAPQEEAEQVAKHMQEVMEAAALEFTDYVKFPVEVSVGKSWGEADG